VRDKAIGERRVRGGEKSNSRACWMCGGAEGEKSSGKKSGRRRIVREGGRELER